jgi:hypothetical protein
MALCSERLQLYQREWRRRVFRVSRWFSAGRSKRIGCSLRWQFEYARDSVTAGVVSAYVEDLDHGSTDLHRFVAAGLIYPSEVNPDFDEMWLFYQRPHWRRTLSKFANIDEDDSTVFAEALKFMAARL